MVKSGNYRFRPDENIYLTVPDELLYFFSEDEKRLRPQTDKEKEGLFRSVKAVI